MERPYLKFIPFSLGIALIMAPGVGSAGPNDNAAPAAAIVAAATAGADTPSGSAYAGTHPYGPFTAAMETPAPDTIISVRAATARRPNPAHNVVLVPPLPPIFPTNPLHPVFTPR